VSIRRAISALKEAGAPVRYDCARQLWVLDKSNWEIPVRLLPRCALEAVAESARAVRLSEATDEQLLAEVTRRGLGIRASVGG
jgi:hypothetical protein